MGLLDLLKKENKEEVSFPISIKATAEGKIVQMKDIPDPVFSEGLVGPCIGIEPEGGTIVAPCSGKILQLSDTLHAFGIEGDGGMQMLVHIGIDTVSMNGDGFSACAKLGDVVKAGQPIIKVDFDKVKAAGHPTVVITIMTNPSDFKEVTFTSQSEVHLGDDLIVVNN